MAVSSTIRVEQSRFLDPRWRLSNHYTITDKAGRAVPFRPNTAQLRFLDEVHSLNLILKARQLGFTTLHCLVHLDACLFRPHTRAGVIAHRVDDAKVIFRDKVRFPYDRLDEGLKAAVPAVQDSADTLTFGNNSSLRVSTSMRSGTLQLLHVSEFGKICAPYPDKAREIVTGALNTVEAGQFVVIESTAEGQEGAFYDLAQKARMRALSGAALTSLDYRFHVFPWWGNPGYALQDTAVVIGAEDARYFEGLEAEGIRLSPAQKRWWARKAETLGGDMKREYPATPCEAFEQGLEGAYFAHDLFAASKQGRIGGFPFDPRATVQSFWGLGLRRLRAYRKEWDESRGVWKDRPRHDDSSHGADAFLTFACNYTPP